MKIGKIKLKYKINNQNIPEVMVAKQSDPFEISYWDKLNVSKSMELYEIHQKY